MKKNASAKPVLKWAGGKGQLIEQISTFLPDEIKTGGISRYAEPFIGGGAVFLHIAQNYPIEEFYISDLNHELIVLYKTIQKSVEQLVEVLGEIQHSYHALSGERQKKYFYDIRSEYNDIQAHFDYSKYSPGWIKRTAQIIFLNRTCFNGLFRVNSSGKFNVPFGAYKKPRICDPENLRAVSRILKNAEIHAADFTDCERFADAGTFVYFDPPYRPLSKTASFTSYSRFDFGDDEQARLADCFARLHKKGARLLLSNSDPKNENPADDFLEKLYDGFNIHRVSAARNINSVASKRGPIYELLITNY